MTREEALALIEQEKANTIYGTMIVLRRDILEAALREPVKEVPLPDSEGWWWEWNSLSSLWVIEQVWLNAAHDNRFYVYGIGVCRPGRWVKVSPPPPASEPLSRSRLKREAVQRGEELPSFAPTEASEPTSQPPCPQCHGAKFIGGGGTSLPKHCPMCNEFAELEDIIKPVEQAAHHTDSVCGSCSGPLEVTRDAICETCAPDPQGGPTAVDSATAELRAENERLKAELAPLRKLVEAKARAHCTICSGCLPDGETCQACGRIAGETALAKAIRKSGPAIPTPLQRY